MSALRAGGEERAMAKVRVGERGAAAVEFALILFPLLLLVFGIIAYAYMFSFRQALSQAASEGARAAVGASTATQSTAAAKAAVAGALSTYNMTCGTNNLSCAISSPFSGTLAGSPTAPAPTCPTTHTCVQVYVTYPYRAHSLLPTIPGFGFTLPSSLSFSSVVQVS
ncbi:MAG: TadE/TadG family type IV pilus assembly protein [Nocardioides sp.]